MSDNITLNPGSGGATLAASNVSNIYYQLTKVAYETAGTVDSAVHVAVGAGLPVQQDGTWNLNNISGTVSLPTGAATSAKQPGFGTAGIPISNVVTVQGIAGATAITVAGSVDLGSSLPAGTNNIGTITLPTGAATSAKQPALGTAGTASTDVITVQGIAGGVAQPISGTVTVGSFGSTVGLSSGSNIVGKVGIDQTTNGTTNRVNIGTDGAVAINAAIPAGTNNIGSVTISQAVPGTSNKVFIGSDGVVAIGGAIPSGTNVVGKVGIDQTTPGTSNGVAINLALPAGTSVIGKVGIDQTTPGTTNKVDIGSNGSVTLAAAVPAGTNIIGKVTIDQSTPGTTNAVALSTAIPSGTNIIGKVAIDQTTPGTTNGVAIASALPAGTNNIGTITLPTGAATSAKQPAIGMAGSATTDVITILGISGATPVTVNGSVSVSSFSASVVLASGSNIAGKFGIDQTTNGTTNRVNIGTDGTVALNAAVPSGTNIIGKVGIDQSTPGTTNGVSLTTAIPAGSNNIGTITLPSGAATAAKQPALGTAGSPASDVITVQGVTGGHALPVSGTVTVGDVTLASALPAGTNILGKIGIDQTTPGTTNRVDIGSSGTVAIGTALPYGTNSIGSVSINNPLPVGSNVIGQVSINQATPGTTNGVQINAAIPAGSNIIGNVRIDQTTPGVTNGVAFSGSLPAGSNIIGSITLPTGAATSALQPGYSTAGYPSANVSTIQGIASGYPVPINEKAATSGGCQVSVNFSQNNTNGIVIKNTNGQVYGFALSNQASSVRYVKFYNKATAPTVGTDTPVMVIQLPGNTNGSGSNLSIPTGISFSLGIGIGITCGIANGDTTAPAFNDVAATIIYA
jgi:hypothetical protein